MLVADKDRVRSVAAVGYADVAAKKPISADNLFWIASMTKPVTTTAIMMLQDEGKLSVNDPVAKYLPELAGLKTADGKPGKLTPAAPADPHLRHGRRDAARVPRRAEARRPDTLLRQTAAAIRPGTKWEYCPSGINSLGRIVEVVSGESYPEFLQKRLFDPLGMKDTTFYPTREQIARLAKSYRSVAGELEEVKFPILDRKDPASRDHFPAANGGLFSTATDYGRFCRMLLNSGKLDGRQYLKPESVKLMSTVQTGELPTGFTTGNGWGLGCCVVRRPQE